MATWHDYVRGVSSTRPSDLLAATSHKSIRQVIFKRSGLACPCRLYGADATAAGVVRALAWPTINRMLGLPLPPETFRDVSMKNFSVFDAQRRSEVYHAVTQVRE